jgi:hypothetical protein
MLPGAGTTTGSAETPMRIVLMALWIALLAMPAQAQRAHGGRHKSDAAAAPSADTKKKKANAEERAAKAAIEKLPDRPYDPWGKMR